MSLAENKEKKNTILLAGGLIIFVLACCFFLMGKWLYNFSSDSPILSDSYRIACDESWYPLMLYGEEGNITGFSMDLLQAIADEQQISITPLLLENNEVFKGLDLKLYDGAVSSTEALSLVTLYDQEDERFISSAPYYLLGPVLVASTSSDIYRIEDMKGNKIGVISGSNSVELVERNAAANFVFYDYKNRFNMIEDVLNNELNAMIMNVVPAYGYANSVLYRGRLRIVSTPLTKEGISLFVGKSKNSNQLIQTFNKGLENIKRKGLYDQLLEKWELVNPEKITLPPSQNSPIPKLPRIKLPNND